MSHPNKSYNEGVEVDFYDRDDGNFTIIHDVDQTPEGILATSTSQSHHEALHNLNRSVIRKPVKEVTFSNIKVRTYPICVGDNPACTDGVPLTIDWQYFREYNFTVDYYERKLEKWANSPDSPTHPNRYPRKTEDDLRISAADRIQLLLSSGAMPQEATLAFRQVEAERRKRRASIRSLHFLQIMYAWERLQRATRNATVGRASKRKEQLMLKPYRDKLNDSIEICVDEINSRKRWFAIGNKSGRSNSSHHKNKKPAIVLNQSYDTASFATNTPRSVVSYNGDTLFPPTPESPPLKKTMAERNMTEFEPRVIDMTGQVSYGISAAPIAKSPTLKRTNKPSDRFLDDDSSTDLLGEGIMDRSMDYSVERKVDRYAPAHQTSPRMDEDISHTISTPRDASADSVSSTSNIFSIRQLDWISGAVSIASGQPMPSDSNQSREPMPSSDSNHSHKSQKNDMIGSMSVISNGSNAGSDISNTIHQLTGFTMRMSNAENEDRGYFLDADERYY